MGPSLFWLLSSLQVNPSDYLDVTHILVDPSCSGSGIFSRIDFDSKVHNCTQGQCMCVCVQFYYKLHCTSLNVCGCFTMQKPDMGRLRSLSSFQKRILKHALSFPSVKKVVYSTCSVHCEVSDGLLCPSYTCAAKYMVVCLCVHC